jgi:1-deoxy-D-xylulose-5-phosphate synthase
MQPKDEDELVDMLHTGLELGAPAFIRYPRGPGTGVRIKDQPRKLEIGHAEVLREGSNIVLWALGPMIGTPCGSRSASRWRRTFRSGS